MEQIMSKKQKIVVSIVGIFLVLLTLLGITYAYFLTRVKGNTNDASVIITTANLLLKYTDGNGLIETEEEILPGTTIESKTFSVENKGTETINNYGVYIENVINEFERTQDLKLTLLCKVYDIENQKYLENDCNGLTDYTYPVFNELLVSNSIGVNMRHDYTLTVTYVNEETIDQSNDMNKNVKGKVQIYDLNDSIDIFGTIANAEEGDYIVLGNDLQFSSIIDGKYNLVGLTPETYTIYLKNDVTNNLGETITTIKGSKNFIVEIGENVKFEDDTLYITNSTDKITLNITNISSELTIELGN